EYELDRLRGASRQLEPDVETVIREVAACVREQLRSERQALRRQDRQERELEPTRRRGGAGRGLPSRASAEDERSGQGRGTANECATAHCRACAARAVRCITH